MENPMREIRIEKITLNVGVGEPGDKLEKVSGLLQQISGAKPAKTTTKKRIPEWNIRPGLEIGVKVTLRGQKAEDLLKRLFASVENKLSKSNFDEHGNLAFGISEYVHIPGAKYDYTVGIIGISVAITLQRRGYSISRKRIPAEIGRSHLIKKDEAVEFIKNKYKVTVNA
jgi:large subunit ribosomal protein L5